jgi:hypothetical protein
MDHRTPAFGLDPSDLADPPQTPDVHTIDTGNVIFHAKFFWQNST